MNRTHRAARLTGVVLLLFVNGCKERSDKITLGGPQAGQRAAATTSAEAKAERAETTRAKAAAPVGASPSTPPSGELLLTGNTVAYRRATLAPKVGGTIAKISVRAGQAVKARQPLVILEQTDFALRLRQARAAQNTAKARLDAVRVEWKRLGGLLKERAVPRSQFDKADANFSVASAAKAQADVAVAMARRTLANTVVRAPFAGIVTRVFAAEGEATVTMPPTRLLTLEQTDRLEVHVQVPEGAMGRMREGTALSARFDAIDLRLSVKVSRIVRSVDPGTRNFLAIVELDNTGGRLRPGMFAQLRLLGSQQGKRR